MQPVTRLVLKLPIYALGLLPDNTLVVSGGGGTIKSGVPNSCILLTLDEVAKTLTSTVRASLPNAGVALATNQRTIHVVIDSGLKTFYAKADTISPASRFHHDVRVSATVNQTAVDLSADGSTLALAAEDGTVCTLALPRYELLFRAPLHTKGITDIALSPDGSLLCTVGRDQLAIVSDARTGALIQTILAASAAMHVTHKQGAVAHPRKRPPPRHSVRVLRFAANGALLVAAEGGREGGFVAVWHRVNPPPSSPAPDAAPPSQMQQPFAMQAFARACADAVVGLTVTADGSAIAVATVEGHVCLLRYDAATAVLARVWASEGGMFAALRRVPPIHDLPVTGMLFTESGNHLVTSAADGSVAVWDARGRSARGVISPLVFVVVFLVFAIVTAVAVWFRAPAQVPSHDLHDVRTSVKKAPFLGASEPPTSSWGPMDRLATRTSLPSTSPTKPISTPASTATSTAALSTASSPTSRPTNTAHDREQGSRRRVGVKHHGRKQRRDDLWPSGLYRWVWDDVCIRDSKLSPTVGNQDYRNRVVHEANSVASMAGEIYAVVAEDSESSVQRHQRRPTAVPGMEGATVSVVPFATTSPQAGRKHRREGAAERSTKKRADSSGKQPAEVPEGRAGITGGQPGPKSCDELLSAVENLKLSSGRATTTPTMKVTRRSQRVGFARLFEGRRWGGPYCNIRDAGYFLSVASGDEGWRAGIETNAGVKLAYTSIDDEERTNGVHTDKLFSTASASGKRLDREFVTDTGRSSGVEEGKQPSTKDGLFSSDTVTNTRESGSGRSSGVAGVGEKVADKAGGGEELTSCAATCSRKVPQFLFMSKGRRHREMGLPTITAEVEDIGVDRTSAETADNVHQADLNEGATGEPRQFVATTLKAVRDALLRIGRRRGVDEGKDGSDVEVVGANHNDRVIGDIKDPSSLEMVSPSEVKGSLRDDEVCKRSRLSFLGRGRSGIWEGHFVPDRPTGVCKRRRLAFLGRGRSGIWEKRFVHVPDRAIGFRVCKRTRLAFLGRGRSGIWERHFVPDRIADDDMLGSQRTFTTPTPSVSPSSEYLATSFSAGKRSDDRSAEEVGQETNEPHRQRASSVKESELRSGMGNAGRFRDVGGIENVNKERPSKEKYDAGANFVEVEVSDERKTARVPPRPRKTPSTLQGRGNQQIVQRNVRDTNYHDDRDYGYRQGHGRVDTAGTKEALIKEDEFREDR